jgi:hypothetical protein
MRTIDYFYIIASNLIAAGGFLVLMFSLRKARKFKQINKADIFAGSGLLFIGLMNFIYEIIKIANRHR